MLDAVPKRLTLCKFWLIPCNVTKHQQTSWTDPAISLPRNVGQDNPRQRPGHLPWCRAHAAPAKCSASFACWSNAHGELRTWISCSFGACLMCCPTIPLFNTFHTPSYQESLFPSTSILYTQFDQITASHTHTINWTGLIWDHFQPPSRRW